MAERRDGTGRTPGAGEAARTSDASPVPDRERVILLECRMEQFRSQLEVARAEADHARAKLAEATAREAEHAGRHGLLHAELAEAREEIAALHQRLDQSEALRAELEGHLFESGAKGEAQELIRLRRELFAERHRAMVNERSVARLRDRVEELLASREILLTRVAEWQQLVREEGPEAADLSGYLSELLREIFNLERRSSAGEGREAVLLERLARAGVDPDEDPEAPLSETPAGESGRSSEPGPAPETSEPAGANDAPSASGPSEEIGRGHEAASAAEEPKRKGREADPIEADPLIEALAKADVRTLRSELVLRAGRAGAEDLPGAVRPWIQSPEPEVRAAAYEALGRLLERDPEALESDLRVGLADSNARVRRRVVLVAATARGLELRSLLGPLKEDRDPQVRRVVQEVLRHASPEGSGVKGPSRPDPLSLTASQTVP